MTYKQVECTLRISNPETDIHQLSQLLSNVRAITIREIYYTTASADQETLTITILGFSDHKYITASDSKTYTKLIMLRQTIDTSINYFNPSLLSYDVEHEHPSPLTNLSITCLIDGEYNSDISDSNPLLLKIVFFCDE